MQTIETEDRADFTEISPLQKATAVFIHGKVEIAKINASNIICKIKDDHLAIYKEIEAGNLSVNDALRQITKNKRIEQKKKWW